MQCLTISLTHHNNRMLIECVDEVQTRRLIFECLTPTVVAFAFSHVAKGQSGQSLSESTAIYRRSGNFRNRLGGEN